MYSIIFSQERFCLLVFGEYNTLTFDILTFFNFDSKKPKKSNLFLSY